ncbi:GGDEF domain-containing protein [Cognatilysobacter lacus]|uniref:diguanylate cyclase n=1 Tax=Cognatilysobacter lacus TaxID=1643323 RepID=A0A5D8Z9H9_9GAMM|nr:diguanylate cyclase [Lysobacter lacus]TZF91499.1 diguanylate cyclase [Lysobacter lacus]
MAFDRLLSRDSDTRLRLQRQLMGAGSYMMFLLPGALAVRWGWTDFGYPGLCALSGVAIAVNAVFFIAIRSGYSRRFADAALLVPQILVALALAITTLHFMRSEARSIMLMLFVAMFFFGLFGLTTRQFLRLSALAVLSYAALIAAEFQGLALHTPAFRMELLRLVSLLMITVWLSFIGGYFASLRQKLADRRDALRDALAQVKELSERDELTGVHNRRHLMRALERERQRALRVDAPFSIAILDLDRFKQFNDAHGHQVGDEILGEFCACVQQCARELDVLAREDIDEAFGRYGGEEFVMLLPHTPLDGAMLCLERIRATVEATPLRTSAGGLRTTFSAGVAEFHPGESSAHLLARADAAMYRAKHEGRNRVLSATARTLTDPPQPQRSTEN